MLLCNSFFWYSYNCFNIYVIGVIEIAHYFLVFNDVSRPSIFVFNLIEKVKFQFKKIQDLRGDWFFNVL